MTASRHKLSLSSRGARAHFAVAVALISVIPCLSLLYLFNSCSGSGCLTGVQWLVAIFGIVGAMVFGYVLMGRYPATIIRLRSYLYKIMGGNLPVAIDLAANEQDITVIEEALNRVLELLSEKLQTVTKEKSLLEEELFQSQKLEAIGTLAGGVAHEINNPINGIMNYAQLIQDHLSPDDPMSEYANEIRNETERVAKIVTNLLSFARQEKQAHSPERVCDVVESSLSLIRAVMRHDQIAMELDIAADLPRIACRSQQVQQVIMNLLTNARDALNEKYDGFHEEKRVTITARMLDREARHAVRISVEDRGPGISETVRQRIFDPFYTTKPREKGTGLGLSISHGIVKDHGGELSVESQLGEWTRFNLDLPVADAH